MPYEEEDTCQQKMNCTCVTQRHTHVCGLCLCVCAHKCTARGTRLGLHSGNANGLSNSTQENTFYMT
jgi:hypothetical protein